MAEISKNINLILTKKKTVFIKRPTCAIFKPCLLLFHGGDAACFDVVTLFANVVAVVVTWDELPWSAATLHVMQ